MKGLLNWVVSRFASKKFTVWISTMVVTLLHKKLGLDLSPEVIQNILIWVTGAYLGSQGIADGLSKGATSSVPKTGK